MSAEIIIEKTSNNVPSQSRLSSNSLQMKVAIPISKGGEEDEQILQCDPKFLAHRTTHQGQHNPSINLQQFSSNNSAINSQQELSTTETHQIFPQKHKLSSFSNPEYLPHRNNQTNKVLSINQQQCRWESSLSPSIESPNSQISLEDKEIEGRIYAWLDEQGLRMVSPSKKSRDYFEKKKNHIHVFKVENDSSKESASAVNQSTEHTTAVPLIEIVSEKNFEILENNKSVVVDKLIFHSPLMLRRMNMNTKAQSADDFSMKNLVNNVCSCVLDDEHKWRTQSWEQQQIQES